MIIFVEDCDGSRDTFIRDLQSQSRDRIETAAAMLRLIEWLDAMSGDTAVFVCLSHLHLVFLTGPSTNSTASATVMWHVRKGAYVIQFPYVGSELMWQDASIEVEEVFVGRVVDVLVDVSAVGKSEEDRTERSVQLAEVLGRYRRLECCLDSYLQSLCGAMLTVLSRSAEIDGFESSQFVLPPEGLEFLQPEDLGVQILSAQNTGNVCVLVAPLSPERYMVAVPIQRRLKWNKARLKRSGICCDEVVEIIRREVMGIF